MNWLRWAMGGLKQPQPSGRKQLTESKPEELPTTEQQWQECTDPWRMKEFLDGKKSTGIWSDRKHHLFHLAVAHWPESILLADEQKKLADFLRLVAGNPFQPYPQPSPFTHAIEQLAAALHNGEDCHFALHDAFLEAGYPDLAVQFGEPRKGGWLAELLASQGDK